MCASVWAAVCKTEMICQCWRKLAAQGLLLPLSRPPSLGSKGDSVWRQWSLTLLSAVSGGYYYPLGNRSKAICSWQLLVSQSCNWSLVRTWGGAGHRGTFITTHISILIRWLGYRLYGAMKIQAHTHCHKDIWHSKFFSVPSYFFWQYRYIL